ncbi:MAG: glycosyltransferase [Bryobacterales bacterium]|nr:glycosyltransferase [Bryobacteraceae bacterium]MDW8354512.1 glycosyltransferase [Bryobacterales bacterium]
MKTLHLTNAWHRCSGGVATFYRALLEAANARGHQLRLVVPASEDRIEAVGRFGRIYHVQAPPSPYDSDYRVLWPGTYLRRRGTVAEILRQERPDLVEVCDKYTLHYLGGLLRLGVIGGFRPAVIGLSCERFDDTIRAYLRPAAHRLLRPLCRPYMKWLYFPLFDHHITVSEYTAEELRAAGRGHRILRGVWIRPMGVDLERFSPQRRTPERRRQLLDRLGCPEDATVVLYVGRLAPEKNLDLLAETMARLPGRFHLALAGSGILADSLARNFRARGVAASFLGHVADRDELADLYANADVFVHPNPREPFGIAPLEAMASGLPLVAPDRGGVRAYANPGNAWLVPPDPECFAAAVRAAADDAEVRAARVRAARATAERLPWPVVADDFLRLYEELYQLVKEGRNASAPQPSPDEDPDTAAQLLTKGLLGTRDRLLRLRCRIVNLRARKTDAVRGLSRASGDCHPGGLRAEPGRLPLHRL